MREKKPWFLCASIFSVKIPIPKPPSFLFLFPPVCTPQVPSRDISIQLIAHNNFLRRVPIATFGLVLIGRREGRLPCAPMLHPSPPASAPLPSEGGGSPAPALPPPTPPPSSVAPLTHTSSPLRTVASERLEREICAMRQPLLREAMAQTLREMLRGSLPGFRLLQGAPPLPLL